MCMQVLLCSRSVGGILCLIAVQPYVPWNAEFAEDTTGGFDKNMQNSLHSSDTGIYLTQFSVGVPCNTQMNMTLHGTNNTPNVFTTNSVAEKKLMTSRNDLQW